MVIGISDKTRRIEGVDYHTKQLNEILRTPIDYCNPTVPVVTEMVECVNFEGKPDHVLLINIEASPLLHTNQADDIDFDFSESISIILDIIKQQKSI